MDQLLVRADHVLSVPSIYTSDTNTKLTMHWQLFLLHATMATELPHNSIPSSLRIRAYPALAALALIFVAVSCPVGVSATARSGGFRNNAMNVIDACWRFDPNWATNRRALADCAVGFGKDAWGGKYGAIYVVTDSSDNPADPRPGTLRYGAIQSKPLWIIFGRDMVIRLKNELMVNSYKTIDGRGVKVEIAYGPCITIAHVTNVIIHGLSIHDCHQGQHGMVRSSPTHLGQREGSDGDAISVFASSKVWIDHCFLSHSADGLIDVIHASTLVTISNNYFSNHDKVMLLGHDDHYTADKVMKVTIVFNRFATTCIERMPRVRFGFAHVANNKYDGWEMYAIGGSADPTILSEANYFVAQNNRDLKQVTKRETNAPWKRWKWKSSADKFVNGAYFVQSGWGTCRPGYTPQQQFKVVDASMVPAITANAGTLACSIGKLC